MKWLGHKMRGEGVFKMAFEEKAKEMTKREEDGCTR